MRARGPRLGELLERRGALSRDQLLRALRHQKVVGGKLGTCLLEIDALAEDELLRALGEQQGVPFATPDELRNVAADVRSVVPAKVSKGRFAVPVRASSTQVEVAMIDTRDLAALDELAFVTGRRVRPLIASEARVFEALEKYYGLEAPTRFAKLVDRLNRARFLWGAREKTKPSDQLQWDPALGSSPANDAGAEAKAPLPEPPLVTEAILTAPPELPMPGVPRPPHEFAPRVAPAAAATRPAPPPPPTPPPPSANRGPMQLDEAERRLLELEDAEAIGRVLIEAMSGRVKAAALFRTKRQEIQGWLGHGFDAERLESIRVPLDRPSIFFTLREGAPLLRGPLAELPAHAELRGLLGSSVGSDLVVLPLRVRERLAGALLVVPDAGSPSGDTLADLQSLAAKASIALELCIMRKKLHRA
jgi:hypothetical protein